MELISTCRSGSNVSTGYEKSVPKFVEEFNELFCKKFVAAHLVHSNGDPLTFDFVKGFQCFFAEMREEEVDVVKASLKRFAQT